MTIRYGVVEIWPGLCMEEVARELMAKKGCPVRRTLGTAEEGVEDNVSLNSVCCIKPVNSSHRATLARTS